MLEKSFMTVVFISALSIQKVLILAQHSSPNESDRDYCRNAETPSQQRLLDVCWNCSTASSSSQEEACVSLSDCLSEQLVGVANETVAACRKDADSSSSNSGGGPFRPCSVAATAYVILEQIRRLLVEDTIYKNCPQVTGFFEAILKRCGDEEMEKTIQQLGKDGDLSSLDKNNFVVQDVLAKFLVHVGRGMQTYDVVKEDIAALERSKHMKALGAMVVSFALPGLLGLCEAAHFRTGVFLQILALFVIGIYQFTRYGGYWAAVGVGSCLTVMIVELALLILIRKRFFGDGSSEEDAKKSE